MSLSATRFADAAAIIAAELAAAPGAKDGIWTGDALTIDGQAPQSVVQTSAGSDLYGGSAGIAWFLAHQARHTQSPTIETAARAGIINALAVGHAMVNGQNLALYGGAAGIAVASDEAARALGDADLIVAAADLADRIATATIIDAEPAADLMGGKAGIIVALTSFAYARQGPAGALRPAIRLTGERLVEQAHSGWWGARWPDASGPGLCGLGHGASGVGWALHEAGDYLGDDRLKDCARAALRYEAGRFDPRRASWPDLRASEDGCSNGWMDAWCHGAFGIGAVRWILWDRLRDPRLLADALVAMGAARRRVIEANRAPPDRAIDVTLCHGLAGAAELMLLAYEITRQREHLEAARRVGALILRLRDEAGGRWAVGLPGARAVPGLFLGYAGIGVLMLRLDDPRTIPSPLLAGMSARRRRLDAVSHSVAFGMTDAGESRGLADEVIDRVCIDDR